MSNKDLTNEQKKILKELSKDMMELATEVIDEYHHIDILQKINKQFVNSPTDASGSKIMIQIHENSPFLDENEDDTK